MFTDMKGFTSRTAVNTREQLERLLDRQDDLVKPIFKKFDGNIIKTIGDAFMVAFESPTNAVLCGVAIQEDLIKYNATAMDDEKMEIRIGINTGEVNIKGDDYFGEAVNIASRIESISEANEVYFSESVYLSMNKNEIPSAEVGLRHLKGIPDEIKVYKVLRSHQEIENLKTSRKQKAEDSNSYSKTEHNVVRVERVDRPASVQITKMILLFAGGFVGLIFLIIMIMWIFKICPPAGPWMSPPWCKRPLKENIKDIPAVQDKVDNLKNTIRENIKNDLQARTVKPAR